MCSVPGGCDRLPGTANFTVVAAHLPAFIPHRTSAIAEKEPVLFSTFSTMYVFVQCEYHGGLMGVGYEHDTQTRDARSSCRV
jgi:hypothetical protein